MDVYQDISKRDLRELLVKGWMTHDAMWLLQSLQECGGEKANKMNSAAIESMAIIEIQRVTKALGVKDKKVETFDDLVFVLEGAFSIVGADFMKFTFSTPEKNVIEWGWADDDLCFAYKGVKRMGLADQYQCGLLLRIEVWLKGLEVEYRLEPEIEGCLMHKTGACSGRILFNLK